MPPTWLVSVLGRLGLLGERGPDSGVHIQVIHPTAVEREGAWILVTAEFNVVEGMVFEVRASRPRGFSIPLDGPEHVIPARDGRARTVRRLPSASALARMLLARGVRSEVALSAAVRHGPFVLESDRVAFDPNDFVSACWQEGAACREARAEHAAVRIPGGGIQAGALRFLSTPPGRPR